MKKSTRNIATVIGGVAIASLFVGGVAWGQSVFRADREPTPTTTSVVAADPIETTIILSLSPESSAAEGTTVAATATLTPIVAGTVEFFDGATSLGSGKIIAGAASVSLVLPVGAHSITASFTPANTVAYALADAGPVAFTVTAAPVVEEEPVHEEPSGPIRCPAGTQANSNDGNENGGNDTSCFPDICWTIPVPDPAHPECDYAYPPEYYY